MQKKQCITEALTKAQHDAAFVVADLHEAHSFACEAEPVLALLLLDALKDAVELQNRLCQINVTREESLK